MQRKQNYVQLMQQWKSISIKQLLFFYKKQKNKQTKTESDWINSSGIPDWYRDE